MVEDIVDVTTNIVIQDAGNGKNFQVFVDQRDSTVTFFNWPR